MTKNVRVQSTATNVRELPLTRDTVAIVPPQEMYTSYISRKIAGVTDMAVFEHALAKKVNVLIEGPTGAGKTSATLAFAAHKNMAFYATPSSIGLEPSQLFGRMVPTDDGHYAWQDGPVTHLVRHGGVLLINEVNFIPPRVSTVLFSLLDRRRVIQLLDHGGEVITAHKDLLIVADMNAGYKGTNQLNSAFQNRFGIQLVWDYDAAIEKKLVPHTTLRDLSRRMRSSDEITTPVSTNMLMEFVAQAQSDLGWDFAALVFSSKFTPDERPVVSNMVDLMKDDLKREILKVAADNVLQDDEDEWDSENYDLTVLGTKDNPNPHNYPGWEPSMGVYGVDWQIDVEEDDETEEA